MYFKHTRFSSWTHWHTDRFDDALFQNKFFVSQRSEAGQFINLWKSVARKTHWNVQPPQCSEGLFFTLASQATLFIFGIFWQWKLTCRFNGCEEMLIPTIHFILYSPFIRQKIDLMCQNTFLLAKHKAIFCVNCITSRTEYKHMVTKRKHSTHRQPSHLNWWKLTHSNTSYEMEVKVITCICLHHRTSVGCSVKEPAYLVWEKT